MCDQVTRNAPSSLGQFRRTSITQDCIMNENERFLLNADLLRTFVSIAECSNLTVAAGQLCRTQSAISVQLRKLETDLRVELFNRTSKGMTLTDSGEKLLPKARSILKEIKEASRLFDTELTGSVRVGVPDDFNDNMLEQILIKFAHDHPGVNVEAVSGCTSSYPAAVRDSEIDVAVCSGPHQEGGDILGTEKTVWAVKRGVSIASGQVVPVAILDRSCWWRDLPMDALNSIGRNYRVAFRSNSFSSLRAAVRAGFASEFYLYLAWTRK
jgi:DNA-binding transcriptional LysR family regulator